MRPLALLVIVVIAGAACSDPTEAARSITVRNDTAQLVVLGDQLNDRIAPGDQATENVSVDLNPYRFHVLDAQGGTLGCLVT